MESTGIGYEQLTDIFTYGGCFISINQMQEIFKRVYGRIIEKKAIADFLEKYGYGTYYDFSECDFTTYEMEKTSTGFAYYVEVENEVTVDAMFGVCEYSDGIGFGSRPAKTDVSDSWFEDGYGRLECDSYVGQFLVEMCKEHPPIAEYSDDEFFAAYDELIKSGYRFVENSKHKEVQLTLWAA